MAEASNQPQLDQLYAAGIASSASATNLGDLFQYTVSVPVTLTRQKSGFCARLSGGTSKIEICPFCLSAKKARTSAANW